MEKHGKARTLLGLADGSTEEAKRANGSQQWTIENARKLPYRCDLKPPVVLWRKSLFLSTFHQTSLGSFSSHSDLKSNVLSVLLGRSGYATAKAGGLTVLGWARVVNLKIEKQALLPGGGAKISWLSFRILVEEASISLWEVDGSIVRGTQNSHNNSLEFPPWGKDLLQGKSYTVIYGVGGFEVVIATSREAIAASPWLRDSVVKMYFTHACTHTPHG